MANKLTDEGIIYTHPVDLFLSLDKSWASDGWENWEAEVLLATVADPQELSSEAIDKLLAIQSFYKMPYLAFTNAVAFEKIVHAFCNNPCVVDTLQPPHIQEITYTVKQCNNIIKNSRYKEEKDNFIFMGEIPGYIAATAKYRDWIVLPKCLAFAQEALFSLKGYVSGNPRYEEHKKIIKAAVNMVSHLDDSTIDANGVAEVAEAVNNESSFSSNLLLQIVGAYLYDPTLKV